MALDVNRLKGKIAVVMNDMMTREENSIDEFSQRIAQAVVEEIEESTIIYTSGLIAPSGGGPVTGVFNGELT